ncbi:MAG: sporulation initiation factor Spo0A C-terminal domain-containing protein [Acetivibrio sp.]
MYQNSGEKAIFYLARKNGVTEDEIRRELEKAIEIGMSSTDQEVQKHWKEMSCNGRRPTPEEMISYLTKKIQK